jgi:8-oxo-dGTP diphosphatase
VLTVVAALIESEGELLVCQRRRGDTYELMWEFPGGKVAPGETLQAALNRELREELGVESEIGPEIYRVRHLYSESREPLELIFFATHASRDRIRGLAFERIEWRKPHLLPELDFLPADEDLIEKLATGAIRLPRADSNQR